MADTDRGLLAQAHKEIVDFGMKSRAERLKCAKSNLDFYKGDFGKAPVRDRGNTAYDAGRFPRHSLVMQRIVNVLTMNLYAEGPTRKLAPADEDAGLPEEPFERATKWLNVCYKKNRVDAMFQRADVLSCVSEVAMFQVVATADPDLPVRINLWDSSQFDVWCDVDEPTRPALVAIMDVWDNRHRVRLYTKDVTRVYLTDPSEGSADIGIAVKYRMEEEHKNDWGFLPFAFVHFHLPITEFWTGSPGSHLRGVNDCVNFKMTETFDCIRYNLRPIVKLANVRPDYRVPSPVRPGDVWNLSGASDSTAETNKEPEAEYLQADASFVEADWQDTQSFIDHTLEMNGVPPSVIRMTQDSVRSGVAIVAEQLPVIAWAKSRQLPFSYYEQELAKVVIRVAQLHLGSQDEDSYGPVASDLAVVAQDPNLVLKWPNMYPRIPGQEQDQSDKFRLDERLVSKTMLMMERENLTREEAEVKLEEIAEDLEREQDLFSSVEPDLGNALGAVEAHRFQSNGRSEEEE